MDHDDRAVPLHPFKFAAQLEHILLENPKNARHGADKSTAMKIQDCV
jgi:prolyl oligopeptidase